MSDSRLQKEKGEQQLQLDLHPFSGGAYFGIVVSGFVDDLVDDGVGVIGIVMEEHEFFGAALHDYINGFAPVAVSPAAAMRFVFFGKILRIVDEDVRAFCQFADGFIEGGVAGLVVGSVDQDSIFGFEAETHASLGMVEPSGLQLDAVFKRDASALDIVKIAPRFHLADIHREVRRGHLIGEHLFEAAHPAGALEEEAALRIHIQRAEEGHALNMVPMKVRDEDVGGKGAVAEFALQLLSEDAESGAAVKDVDAVTESHFNAGGVAPIAHILGLWSWRGTTHAPELNPHRL